MQLGAKSIVVEEITILKIQNEAQKFIFIKK